MPFVVRYPVRVRAVSVNTDLITNVDFATTLLDFAQEATPADLQGKSFCSNLSGKTSADWPTSMYYRYWMGASGVPAHYGVRTKRYKLIYYYGTSSGWELYDLLKDPLEINNVYNDPDYAGIVSLTTAELNRLREYYGDTT